MGQPVAVDDLPAGSLDEAEAKQLFARFGVPGARERIVETPAQAEAAARELGARVALKILSSELTQDRGGRCGGEPAARAGRRHWRVCGRGAFWCGGTELILGMHRDALGTAILLGMGGVTAELFNDTTLRLLPPHGGLSREDALELARELKTWPPLDGFRGRSKADIDALVSAIVAFSQVTAQLGDRLVEAEINPLFVLPQGQGVRAADAVVALSR